MYEIYINENPLIFTYLGDERYEVPGDDQNLVAPYYGERKLLLNYIDMLEKSRDRMSIILLHESPNVIWDDFVSYYKLIVAAGGIVRKNDKVLCIYRKGFWDLPKGKVDLGEELTEAALREVKEETGIGQLILDQHFQDTYHTYKTRKGKRILKKTVWFLMSSDSTTLQPENREGIKIATWLTPNEFLAKREEMHANMRHLIMKYQSLQGS